MSTPTFITALVDNRGGWLPDDYKIDSYQTDCRGNVQVIVFNSEGYYHETFTFDMFEVLELIYSSNKGTPND